MFIIKRHKGHSGKSVFEWRVYRIITLPNGAGTIQSQLGKFRNEQTAIKFKTALDAARDLRCRLGRFYESLTLRVVPDANEEDRPQ